GSKTGQVRAALKSAAPACAPEVPARAAPFASLSGANNPLTLRLFARAAWRTRLQRGTEHQRNPEREKRHARHYRPRRGSYHPRLRPLVFRRGRRIALPVATGQHQGARIRTADATFHGVVIDGSRTLWLPGVAGRVDRRTASVALADVDLPAG